MNDIKLDFKTSSIELYIQNPKLQKFFFIMSKNGMVTCEDGKVTVATDDKVVPQVNCASDSSVSIQIDEFL